MHAQQREIALAVLADEFGGELGAVIEDDVDLVGVGDDVVVGDDEAGRIDDEAGAERVDPPRGMIGIAAAPAAAPPPWPRRFLKNSSKNSSIGEPGGRSGMPFMRASTFCDVEILTTASITCSATSAMFSGPRAAAGHAGRTMIAAASAAMAGRRRSHWERWQDMKVCAPARRVIGICPKGAPVPRRTQGHSRARGGH